MVISQTPLRISLLGGGTDFEPFFKKKGGAVLSLAIDKYIYVIVKERFDDRICINYSKRENVERISEIEHELVREAMKKSQMGCGVEVTTLADIPSEGSGLGSSSSVTVGLLNAFYAYRGIQVTAAQLAREACEIEIEILGKPIGIQDQYIAAYGGLSFFEFCKDGSVKTEKVGITVDQRRKLVSNLLIFYTNKTRRADSILSEQKNNIESRLSELTNIRDLAYSAREELLSGHIDSIGDLLNQNWLSKKKLASSISNTEIDSMYESALKGGARGGKVAGAGGGGFLLVYCPRERQENVRHSLAGYRELPFMISRDGSKIIFNVNNQELR